MFILCRARHRLTTSPIQFSRPRRPYRRLALSLLIATPMIAACSKHNPTKPQTFTLAGRVRLVGTLMTRTPSGDIGDSTGVQLVEDADSVRIYLCEGASLKDSTRTTAGGYAFTGLRGGSYAVAADLWGGIGDTITVTNLTADVALDTLVLVSSATMPAFPNPFSTSTTVQFDISANSMVEMSARKPSGLVVNTLVQRGLPAGVHRVVWDGTDGASNPVPSGTYWILFRVGADYRARLVAKS